MLIDKCPARWDVNCPEELNLIEVKSLINDLVREVTSRLNQGYSVDITLNGKIVDTYYSDGRVKEYDL